MVRASTQSKLLLTISHNSSGVGYPSQDLKKQGCFLQSVHGCIQSVSWEGYPTSGESLKNPERPVPAVAATRVPPPWDPPLTHPCGLVLEHGPGQPLDRFPVSPSPCSRRSQGGGTHIAALVCGFFLERAAYSIVASYYLNSLSLSL
jgi:hypothetical protein